MVAKTSGAAALAAADKGEAADAATLANLRQHFLLRAALLAAATSVGIVAMSKGHAK